MAIALVTGTSSGIGLATAVTLARGGHKVIATMRNLDGASELRKIVSAEGLPVTVAALDVDDDGSVTDAVDKVLAENGCIDIVNNAGVSSGGGSVGVGQRDQQRMITPGAVVGDVDALLALGVGLDEGAIALDARLGKELGGLLGPDPAAAFHSTARP